MTALRSGIRRTTLALPVVLFALLALAAPGFLAPQNLANIIGQITALLIVSLGQMLVALVAGIDLSVGSVMSLAGSLVATQSDPMLGIGLALLLGLLVGVVNGLGVAVAGIHPLIMTLATDDLPAGPGLPGAADPRRRGAGQPGQPGQRHALGRAAAAAVVRAVRRRGGPAAAPHAPGAAHLRGRRQCAQRAAQRRAVVAVVVSAYVACSLLAVVAGIYLAARVASGDPTMGASFGLESVTAVALGGVQLTGGVGSVLGVVTGALSLGLMTNGINLFGISPFLRGALTGVLLLAAVCAQRRKVVGL
jgi:ribose transport system permease protein